jgi:DNA-binding response OmpR family regulator
MDGFDPRFEATFMAVMNESGLDSRLLVLVADDDEDILALVEFRLAHAGYGVVKAPDGEAALRLAAQCRPDLVILDVRMPGIDGYEVTRQIRASTGLGPVPVILISAGVQEQHVARGYEAGASDYMRKPFSGQELLERVAMALGSR